MARTARSRRTKKWPGRAQLLEALVPRAVPSATAPVEAGAKLLATQLRA